MLEQRTKKKIKILPKIQSKNKSSKIVKKNKPVKQIILNIKHPESTISKKEGDFFTVNNYDTIIKNDCDVYGIDEDGNKKLLLKFRKDVIPHSICQMAYNSLEKEAQHLNSNRGAAAGKININKLPKYVGDIVKQDKYRVFYKSPDGTLRKDNISNLVRSNIIGYYDMPDRNKLAKYKTMGKTAPKCRQTAFTRDKVEQWLDAIPIIELGNQQFKKLLPDRYKKQYNIAKKTPDFQINNTAYSTVTINYNYRSACHKDAGDFQDGFGNLMVLEKNKCITDPTDIYPYEGGYLGFPKYGVCVDVRQGDYLAMDVHEWHCNSKLICGCSKKNKCTTNTHFGRLSLVCYLRNGMIKCK